MIVPYISLELHCAFVLHRMRSTLNTYHFWNEVPPLVVVLHTGLHLCTEECREEDNDWLDNLERMTVAQITLGSSNSDFTLPMAG